MREIKGVHIYIYIYICRVQVTPGVILSNITPSNNLLSNSYFENLSVKLYVRNKHANQM